MDGKLRRQFEEEGAEIFEGGVEHQSFRRRETVAVPNPIADAALQYKEERRNEKNSHETRSL